MSRRQDSVFDILTKAPWWISAGLAVVSYILIRWGIPALLPKDPNIQSIGAGFSNLAPYAALLFGLIAVGSAVFASKRRALVNDQQSLQSIRETSWKDFEYLVAEAFRRQGYSVDYSLVQGADGGVDLTLRKGGRVSLVQCKQWKVYSVGAPVIREMFGIMTAEHADEAIIVTTGNFTREAQSFAMGKAIQLIDGAKLLELVRSVQTASEIKEQIQAAGQPISDRKAVTITSPGPENSSVTTVPACPQCGSQMKLRTARRGAKSGSQFWGCSTYPKCQGKRELHG